MDRGRIHSIGVDGSDEADLEVIGSSPEWVDASTIAFVSRDQLTVEVARRDGDQRGPKLRLADLTLPDGKWRIDSFAIDLHSSASIVALRDASMTQKVEDDRYLLVEVPATGQTMETLIGPVDFVVTTPDVGPSGELIIATANGLVRIGRATRALAPVPTVGTVVLNPSFSVDGESVLWVGGPDSSNATNLFVGRISGDELRDVQSIASDRSRPMEEFPVLPDW